MTSSVEYGNKKYVAKQTLKIRGLDELLARKETKYFPEFTSEYDPNSTPFFVVVDFKPGDNGCLRVWVMNQSDRDVFVYKATISNERFSGVCQKRLVKKGSGFVWASLCSVPDAAADQERPDLILFCEITYGGEDWEDKHLASSRTKERENNASRSAICRNWQNIFESDNDADADITFIFDVRNDDDTSVARKRAKKIIRAHKLVLTTQSSYFRAMFSLGMKEAESKEIRVPDATPRVFREFLKFLYGGDFPDNIGELAASLLPLADRYAVGALKKRCELEMSNSVTAENVANYAVLSHLHGCDALKKVCFEFFKGKLTRSNDDPTWIALKRQPDLVVEILQFITKKVS